MIEKLDQYREFRRESFNEQTLLSFRVGWLLAVQGLFFTAFAVLLTADMSKYWWIACIVLPSMGIVVSWMARYPIKAAIETINYWHKKERDLWSDPDIKTISLEDRSPEVHYLSMQLPGWLPFMFITLWLVLSAITTYQAWFGGLELVSNNSFRYNRYTPNAGFDTGDLTDKYTDKKLYPLP